MAAKFFALCASVLLVNTISACPTNLLSRLAGATIGSGYSGCGCGAPAISASGGGLGVSSASPIAPNGIALQSNNEIQGNLQVVGQLPLLAAVAFQGNLPTAGSAGVNYSCGNGQVGIASQSLGAAGYGAGYGNVAGLAGYAGQIGLANAGRIGLNGIGGCGCGY